MQNVRAFGNALAVALISIGLMVGALSISLVEFVPEATQVATEVVFPSPIPLTPTNTLIPTLTATLGAESPTPSSTPTPTITSTPPSSCIPPSGWSQIIIQSWDTLGSIAARYNITTDTLRSANCLLTDSLVSGTILYVPPVATITPIICVPGAAGWIRNYIVNPGDTIYAIATSHYTTASLLRYVNCRTSDYIYAGEVLWVPNIATRTPYPTPLPGSTITPYPTEPLTETALPFTLTVVPSDTPVPPTATQAPTATAIPTPMPSLTPVIAPGPPPPQPPPP
jgi:LysM repeat protein